MKHLFAALSSAKANVTELEKLREIQTQLQLQGIHPEAAAANFPLLTAKMAPKEVAALKASFPRKGFVEEIASLEKEAKEFLAQFTGKGAALPSQAWKLLHSAKPEAILWAAHTSKAAGVQAKFKSFYTEWPQARLKIPYTQMQEMRIVPGIPGYEELLDKPFFDLMDAKLETVEEMKVFLEPYSPPAPPPPIHLRRPRAAKKEAKPAKSKKKDAVEGEEAISLENADMSALLQAAAADETVAEKPVKGVKAAAGKAAPAPEAPAKAAASSKKTAAPEPAKKAAAVVVKGEGGPPKPARERPREERGE